MLVTANMSLPSATNRFNTASFKSINASQPLSYGSDQVQFGNMANEKSQKALKEKAVRDFATEYSPRSVKLDNGKDYSIYNPWFSPTTDYNSHSLQDLLETLEKKKAFSFQYNHRTGLARTSDTENDLMLRQWLTDSCMLGFLQRNVAPNEWKKSMITSAAVYNTSDARKAINESTKNPNWYRQGGVMNGVFHIYEPKSLVYDDMGLITPEHVKLDSKWFNQKRLESQALLLSNLADTLQAGFKMEKEGGAKPWGFTPDEILETKNGKFVGQALVDMTRYIMAVNKDPDTGKYNFEAPSASSWEELPFPEGMTWDAATCVMALEKVRDLMHQPDANKAITSLREKLLQLPGGNVLSNTEELNKCIEAGRSLIEHRVNIPLQYGDKPFQTPNRAADTSMLLLAASDYQFDPKSKLNDAETRIKLTQSMLNDLSGNHGVRRYNEFLLKGDRLHDSYLNIDYHFPKEGAGYGSTDASTEEDLKNRQKSSSPTHAAEWGLGLSAGLQALGQAKLDLLTTLSKATQNSPEEQKAKKLLQDINPQITHLVNQICALIPGRTQANKPLMRADGTECKDNVFMEAYEVVRDNQGKPKRIPGAHTLPWHAAQSYDGLKKAIQAAKLEETLFPPAASEKSK